MIELDRVSVGYGKDPVIREVSLSLPRGRLVSVIGPNGSGKSTLLRAAAGLLVPSDGEVRVDGGRCAELSRSEMAKRAAYLTQGRNVPDMTVEQLVLHGRFPHLRYPRRYGEKDREIARQAMRQVGIGALADRPLYTLSGGMRQNAYIAMALAQDADYILLDEPTTYLDIAHQLRLMETLRGLADAGKGVAAVLHDLPLAFSFSDSIAVLREGRLAACAPPEEAAAGGLVEEVFGIRLRRDEEDGGYYYSLGAFSPRLKGF